MLALALTLALALALTLALSLAVLRAKAFETLLVAKSSYASSIATCHLHGRLARVKTGYE